ncbi:MAG: TlyA family rRNA (cytidine-2'-O)-methyltransferase, partial [Clostridia bacterium]|nr:TlyA family rRNA (cytidine-2'-O)-methyltransferase [Clostridia bacterium]
MRIDVYLVSAGYAPSRESAKRLIEEGLVTLDGKVITKPSSEVVGAPDITVTPKKYV